MRGKFLAQVWFALLWGVAGSGSTIDFHESAVLLFFLQICKRRMKALNQMKSPHHKTPHKTPQKAFKHLEMMPLTSVKRVLNVVESDGITPLNI